MAYDDTHLQAEVVPTSDDSSRRAFGKRKASKRTSTTIDPPSGHCTPLLRLPESYRAQECIQIYVDRHAQDTPFLVDSLRDQIARRMGVDVSVTIKTVHQDADVHILELAIATLVITGGWSVHVDYPSRKSVWSVFVLCAAVLCFVRLVDIVAVMLGGTRGHL